MTYQSSCGLTGAEEPEAEDHEAATALRAAIHQARLRVLPAMALLYVFAYLARGNIAYAVPEMRKEIQISDATVGLAEGVFFIAYSAFQVPANLMLMRFGPRIWLGSIISVWALLSAACGLCSAWWHFLVLRLALGFAEAGLAPGVTVYLNRWFPPSDRGFAMAVFLLGAPSSVAFGAPVSSALVHFIGWRWMFAIEAAPVLLAGFCVFCFLPSGPDAVGWLSPLQKQLLSNRLGSSTPAVGRPPVVVRGATRRALRQRSTWLLGFLYSGQCFELYGLLFWLPKAVDRVTTGDLELALGTALPYVAACVVQVLAGVYMPERHIKLGCTVSAVVTCLVLTVAAFTLNEHPACCYACLALCPVLVYWVSPQVLAYISNELEEVLRGCGPAIAAGIAATNGIGHLGAFTGPYLFGVIDKASETAALVFLALPYGLIFAIWGLCCKAPVARDDSLES